MKKALKIASALLISILLTACGDPTLDTSSDKAMKESVQKIMSDLSPADQERFKKTVTGIYVLGGLATLGGKSPEDIKSSINSKLDGKTAKEIFEIGNEIRSKLNKKQGS